MPWAMQRQQYVAFCMAIIKQLNNEFRTCMYICSLKYSIHEYNYSSQKTVRARVQPFGRERARAFSHANHVSSYR